jgi:hypothetical protein
MGYHSPKKPQPFTGNKNHLIPHPVTGSDYYGYVPLIHSNGETIEPGAIVLKIGRHISVNKGFGANHIWSEHEKELRNLDYSGRAGVSEFVSKIIRVGTPIHCEFNCIRGNHRPTVLRSRYGIAVLEKERLIDGTFRYSVVTAYTKKYAEGSCIGKIEKAP